MKVQIQIEIEADRQHEFHDTLAPALVHAHDGQDRGLCERGRELLTSWPFGVGSFIFVQSLRSMIS